MLLLHAMRKPTPQLVQQLRSPKMSDPLAVPRIVSASSSSNRVLRQTDNRFLQSQRKEVRPYLVAEKDSSGSTIRKLGVMKVREPHLNAERVDITWLRVSFASY